MFSSRGRHTILVSDWSSDVCSSDLGTVTLDASGVAHPSASQGPLSAGSYSFIAHYNGDPNYTATDSPCEPLKVTALTPTAPTEIHKDRKTTLPNSRH